MTIKRAPQQGGLVLSEEEHRRVRQFVGLLVTIAHRTQPKKRKPVKSINSKKVKRVRNCREPCFLEQLVYHGLINFNLDKVMNHDRHSCINFDKRSIPYN